MPINHQIRLAARPVGLPKPSDWSHVDEPAREPADGEILVAVEYISLDPAMRGWMNDAKSYIAPVGIGEVMRAYGAGVVTASRHAAFAVGDHVGGAFGVQTQAISDGRGVTKLDTSVAALPVWIGTLGLPGMTAYFGLLEVGRPVAGQTVVVSGAAGAVGSVVGQIAKLTGCRVIGIAGGPEKCKYLVDELGFDGAVDYKADGMKGALRALCPNGIDVFFDNVGGDILDLALTQLARNARVIICGAISQYNATTPVKGPANYLSLLVNRASMTGIVVFDYAARFSDAAREMAAWIAAGTLKSREDIVDGFPNFPEALNSLFRGENHGKLVLRVTG